MMASFAQQLNLIANALGRFFLGPVAWLPGWVSATVIGVVTGVIMLLVFKYTSNQRAIKKARDQIKANLFALSLFKENIWVSLRCQRRLLHGAGQLIYFSIFPMLILTVPMVLVLGQLALWYQARPLAVGEETIVTAYLARQPEYTIETIELVPGEGFSLEIGPVRVRSKNMVSWKIKAVRPGIHPLEFRVGGKSFSKELAVGDSFLPTSIKRPGLEWTEVLLHPREEPFAEDSPVQAVEVDFPTRSSWTSGTDYWVGYWFLVSMVTAFLVKPIFKVNI